MIAPIKKALAPAVVALAAFITSWAATGTFDGGELAIIAAGAITALATWYAPNIASTPVLKALVAPTLALVAVGTAALETGAFSQQELWIGLAGIVTAGLTFTVRNEATVVGA